MEEKMLKITNDWDEIASDPQAIVAFTASWCGPCKLLKPQLVKTSGKIDRTIYIVDVDALDPAVLDYYSIRSVPTVVAHEPEQSWYYVTGRTESEILLQLGE
jgi:thioredoxin 1